MSYRVVATVALAAFAAGGAGSSAAAKPAPKKLLVVTRTQGFRHTEGIEGGEAALKAMAEKTGRFTLDFCGNDPAEVAAKLAISNLKQYDGVVFLNTTGTVEIPDMTAFLDWIKAGHAFIGMHAATDTWHGNEAYIDMIGGEFSGHGQQCEVAPKIDDPKHPATARLQPGFKWFDEIYHHKNNDRAKLHVLLSLDHYPNDGMPTAGQPTDFLLAWTKPYGKGRVFYTAFGHRREIWEQEDFRLHVLGGTLWALRLAK